MTWVLHGTDTQNVYWRRTEDSYVIGFNKKGIGTPFSDESSPPAEIERYAEPLQEATPAAIAQISEKLIAIEADVLALKTKNSPK